MTATYPVGKVFLLALAILFSPITSFAASPELTLALADSTCKSMKQAGEIFTSKTNIKLNYICQASGLLAKGIMEEAIPADYFLSANKKWMDAVAKAGHIDQKAVQTNLSNQLIVASFPSKMGDLELQGLSDLLTPSVKKVLIGNPEMAPFGLYAKQALINAEMWDKIQPKLKVNPKISLSIRSLKKLSLATPGIVAFLYKTNVTDKMKIHFPVPEKLYPKINYYSAPLVHAAQKKEMAKLLEFISGNEAQNVFTSAGFIVNDTKSGKEK